MKKTLIALFALLASFASNSSFAAETASKPFRVLEPWERVCITGGSMLENSQRETGYELAERGATYQIWHQASTGNYMVLVPQTYKFCKVAEGNPQHDEVAT